MIQSEFNRALAYEVLWQVYVDGFSAELVAELDRNGTRARWLTQFNDQIQDVMGKLLK